MGYEAGTASILWPALALVGSHGCSGTSIESIPFSVRLCLCFQGLTPVCGVPAAGSRAPIAGTAAHQEKALAVERHTSREANTSHRMTRHLCDPTKPRAEQRTAHVPPSTAGWIPQGGGRPRLWRFFPRFLIAEKSGPAERPRLGHWSTPGTLEKLRIPCLPGKQGIKKRKQPKLLPLFISLVSRAAISR